MVSSRHKAVVAGLALSLSLGAAAAPHVAAASTQLEDQGDAAGAAGSTPVDDAGDAAVTETEAASDPLPEPAGEGKAALYREQDEGIAASLFSLFSARSASLSPVALSDEMKYFTSFESGRNYDQGLSWGDGYNAMGYYQFDRHYALVPFIQQVYDSNPTKYAMFADVLARGNEIRTAGSLYDDNTKTLTEAGRLLDNAWHEAYRTDPAEFSAYQDAYAYNNYYQPVQNILADNYGVDISDRADCVKGLAWGMCNLFGSGGVQSFFSWAKADSGLSDAMSDRELVTALCNAVINHIEEYAPGQPEYFEGWKNRYRNELNVCLGYISEDEQQAAAQNKPSAPAGDSAGTEAPGPQGGTGAGSDAAADAPSADAPSAGGSNVSRPGVSMPEAEMPSVDSPDAPSGDGASGGSASDAGDGDTANGSEDAPGDEENKPNDDVAAGTGSEAVDDGSSQAGGSTEGQTGPGESGASGTGEEDAKAETEVDKSEKAEMRTVTFIVKGEPYKTVEVEDGAAVSKPSDEPIFDGYTFAGWYLDGEPFDFTTPVTGDMELVAYYQKVAQPSEQKDDGTEAKASEAPAPTSDPDGLPQTGDPASIVMMGAAGIAAIGASVAALGVQRRKQAVSDASHEDGGVDA